MIGLQIHLKYTLYHPPRTHVCIRHLSGLSLHWNVISFKQPWRDIKKEQRRERVQCRVTEVSSTRKTRIAEWRKHQIRGGCLSFFRNREEEKGYRYHKVGLRQLLLLRGQLLLIFSLLLDAGKTSKLAVSRRVCDMNQLTSHPDIVDTPLQDPACWIRLRWIPSRPYPLGCTNAKKPSSWTWQWTGRWHAWRVLG